MLSFLYQSKQPRKVSVIDPKVRILKSVALESNGVITRSSEYVDVSVADNFKQFHIQDFELSNIIATGAVHLLKPVSMRNGDVDNVVNQVDSISSGLDKAIANQSKTE